MMAAILVLTNLPTLDEAKELAEALVTKKLCACVNINSKCHSIYTWDGKIEEAEEYTLLIKTTTNKYIKLEQEIKRLHSYEVPEIISIDIKNGSKKYLNWISSAID